MVGSLWMMLYQFDWLTMHNKNCPCPCGVYTEFNEVLAMPTPFECTKKFPCNI